MSWRERDGIVEVFPHRFKLWLTIGGFAVFGSVSAAIAFAEPTAVVAWAGVALFGVGGIFFVRRYWMRGLLSGKAALILTPRELFDRQSGLRVEWPNVERISFWELPHRGGAQRLLGLDVRDEEPVLARLGALQRAGSALDTRGGHPQFNIGTNLLATTTDELAGLLDRYYSGPIEGVDEVDPRQERAPRRTRFLRWAAGFVLPLVGGILLAALVLRLT